MKKAGILFIALFQVVCLFHPVFALSPRDILIVYNSSVPESRKVAEYYAGRRKVPLSNLAVVDLPFTETIGRSEFEINMLGTVREAVERLKQKGASPAILLVYGIPLRISGGVEKGVDEAFGRLLKDRGVDSRRLVLKLGMELERAVGLEHGEVSALSVAAELPDAALIQKAVLVTLGRVSRLLAEKKIPGAEMRGSSLMFMLAGMSPVARNTREKLPEDAESFFPFLDNDSVLKWTTILNRQLEGVIFRGVRPEDIEERAASVRFVNGLVGEMRFWSDLSGFDMETSASVDSELALLPGGPHRLSGWLLNPYQIALDSAAGIGRAREQAIMVGRLDAPTPELAMRLVDDAISVEETGLDGTFYIDARGLTGDDSAKGSYACFDKHLRNLYSIINDSGLMPVVLNDTSELFAPGSDLPAALYVGWYSLGEYVDAFKWQKGAVGFHVASSELSTLRRKNSKVWGKRMIEEGVSATLGPVTEPFLLSFPQPEQFFPLLMGGEMTLLEVYFKTIPFLSWQQVLIGDPLYRPFTKNPKAIPLKNYKDLC